MDKDISRGTGLPAAVTSATRFRTACVPPHTRMLVIGLLMVCLLALSSSAATVVPAELVLAKGGNLTSSPIKGFFSVNESGVGSSYTFPLSAIRYMVRERTPGTQTDMTTVINLGDENGVISSLRIPADVMTYDLIIAALAAARAT